MIDAPGLTEPNTLSALLRLLGVQTASAYQHRPALTEWFEHNTPNPALRVSMRANGYGVMFLQSLRPMRSTVSGLKATA
ncbi:hypothetical protein BRW65_13385 [Mycobacterium paraffinicum]|uniref:Uncharacterized protein n=1 Tax=Mycobacterium paraffinicum TaxID=53378 RepID=A0A1Q4HU97_9MYCO|nr:hypothetical protein [Mycobacterium paraffinicum]OJZ73281.1 hypothetical protein BRW65_13385 [Mycobacterium paraffinicum]